MSRKTAAQKKARATTKHTDPTQPTSAKHTKAEQSNTGRDEQLGPLKKRKLGREKSIATEEIISKPGRIPQIIETSAGTASHGRQPGQPRTILPSPPRSVLKETKILPPQADDTKLRANYDIHTVNVATSSKIEGKVTSILLCFKDASSQAKSKRKTIIALSSNTKAANKCITIAEIAKREYMKREGAKKVYQYTGCWTRLETYEPVSSTDKSKAHAEVMEKNNDKEVSDEESDDAFEDIKETVRTKVRNATCMVIFLSIEPVARLKELYGEQFHDRDTP